MTASAAPGRFVPDLEADILAIVGGPDRMANRTLLRSKMGTAGGGLAFVLALIGLGALLDDDWVRSMTPDTTRSESTGGPEGGGERFEPPAAAGDITPVTDDRVVQTIPEPARVAPRVEATVPYEAVAAVPRGEGDLIAAAEEPSTALAPVARRQADVSRNQRGGYVAVSPERRDAVHAMASQPSAAMASATAYNLPEKTSEQLERDKRHLLQTRDSLRDLRLR